MNESYWDPVIFKPGDVFLDIGANAGGWTIPASKYYRRVVAFEANPKVADTLVKNLSLNRVNNVVVYSVGLGEKEAVKDLYLYAKNGQDSFLMEHVGLKAWGPKVKTRIMPLDSFDYAPSVIKIDTEGYELNVLKGAYNMIQKHRPQICIETHDERDVGLIQKMLDDYHWRTMIREQLGIKQTILTGLSARTTT